MSTLWQSSLRGYRLLIWSRDSKQHQQKVTGVGLQQQFAWETRQQPKRRSHPTAAADRLESLQAATTSESVPFDPSLWLERENLESLQRWINKKKPQLMGS
ncbi:hypothetical protein ACLKA6_003290 [Drosophila palustris]